MDLKGVEKAGISLLRKLAVRGSSGADSNSKYQMVPCKGSECVAIGRANFQRKCDPGEEFGTTVLLKQASASDAAELRDYFKMLGFNVEEPDPKTRSVKIRGKVPNYEKALGVKFGHYKDQKVGEFRGYSGTVQLPSNLRDKVEGVFGLSDRPVMKPHFVVSPKKIGPFATGKVSTSYTPDQIAKLYNFPAGTDGSGQTIAIVEFGGGYNTSDLQQYFQKLGIPMPDVEAVSVDGATNAPTNDPNGPDGEVALDIEAIGAMAPKAKIKVYFAPNNDQGSIDVLNAIMNDKDQPKVVSISWGGDEPSWTPQTVQSMHNLFQQMAQKGITCVAASGDSGSSDGATDGKNHVDFPASDPNVLGVGGTSLFSKNGKITAESTWNNGNGIFGGGATGGGYSDIFTEPADQANANISDPSKMRGVPDVASDADPDTGVDIIVDGQEGVIGGTSFSAPTWAALISRINQALAAQSLGPVGAVAPVLYQIYSNPQQYKSAFNDIKQGNNGAFKAGPGWDPCTGLGSPNGQGLLSAIQQILAKQAGGGNASTLDKVA